jgi:hypothetical protein
MHKTIVLMAILISTSGCKEEVQPEPAMPPDTATVIRSAVVPAKIDRSKLAEMKWLEGRWRGTGADTPTFYERYSFPTDSTMVAVNYRDSTMTEIADSTIYTLNDGQLSNTGNGPQWVLSAIGGDSIRFEPLARASNSFTWRRISADEWTAVLGAPASGGDSATARRYTMRRVK